MEKKEERKTPHQSELIEHQSPFNQLKKKKKEKKWPIFNAKTLKEKAHFIRIFARFHRFLVPPISTISFISHSIQHSNYFKNQSSPHKSRSLVGNY